MQQVQPVQCSERLVQNGKKLMDEDFQVIDISASAECSADCSADSSASSASLEPCSASLTAQEIAVRLGISVRSVYSYAKQILEVWSWVNEVEFRSEGRYTPRALEEMGKLKSAKNLAEYAAKVSRSTGNFTTQSSALARVETVASVEILTARPLPEIPIYNLAKTSVEAVRERTQRVNDINDQLTATLTQLIAIKVANKAQELDAKIDEVFADAETIAISQAANLIHDSISKRQ